MIEADESRPNQPGLDVALEVSAMSKSDETPELLKAGQWVEVVSAPAWPDLVGLKTTIREVIPYGSRLGGGPAYILNIYPDGKDTLTGGPDVFMASPEQVRHLPELKAVEIPQPEPEWHVAIEHEGEHYEASFTMDGDQVTVTYEKTKKTAPLNGLIPRIRTEAILREIVLQIKGISSH